MALDHNFDYKNASLLTHLGFGASRHTLTGLAFQENKRISPRAPKKKIKKRKTSDEEVQYKDGEFYTTKNLGKMRKVAYSDKKNLMTKRKVAPSDILT